MRLLPEEEERLEVFLAASLARRRRDRGLLLNAPEAVALLCDEVIEAARDGRGYDDVCALGLRLLSPSDVLEGVPALVDLVQVEALFDEGTLMVSLHHPIGGPPEDGGQADEPDVEINVGRPQQLLDVVNTLDRAVQVTSHYHFFEVTRGLAFDRPRAYGHRLDIPAGTSVRFEPGERREVELVPFGGRREVHGHAGLVDGELDDPVVREQALLEAERRGYPMQAPR